MKRLFPSLLIVIFAAVGIMSVDTAFGRPRKKAPPPQPTLISNVTDTTIAITDASGTRTLMVTKFTEVMINGQKGTIRDLKPGMAVNVTLSDLTHVSRVQASDKK